jgi:hypothetical protein
MSETTGPYGVDLVDVGAANGADAIVQVEIADTSPAGGAAGGVLGCTVAGQITLVTGWDWYTPADPSALGASQYDFETIVTHELGHAVGLGHSGDTGSVMYAYLAPGETRRTVTAQDLSVLDSGGTTPEPLSAAPWRVHAAAASAGDGGAAAAPLSASPSSAGPGLAPAGPATPSGAAAFRGRNPDPGVVRAGATVAISPAGPGKGLATPGTGGAAAPLQRPSWTLAAAATPGAGPAGLSGAVAVNPGSGSPDSTPEGGADRPALAESEPAQGVPLLEQAAPTSGQLALDKVVPGSRAAAVSAQHHPMAALQAGAAGVRLGAAAAAAIEPGCAWAGVLTALLIPDQPDRRLARRPGRVAFTS